MTSERSSSTASGSPPEYDPQKHVHASELRAAGIQVPEEVPDCAWVPRNSFTIRQTGCITKDGKALMRAEVVFLEPFRWLAATFEVSK
jgi:hypothetical protein